ncbi:ABC transporter substrate-binding protein [Engelhardtia mirabilis]|uniref:Bicarbonate-binding protein CmpA n=1 Tax=Engelhardtia mirabilis TaxID=2528011 RepID=A0A518BHB2_9BACT|nr:Bicarbonate-binding protein CmpA precursor [Planctomycetes bacterium Pla133]QDV00693.1 Bicarbonate-binding protein CmpA precursor [Planctomycetes bacterium Pla86]
MTEQSTEGTIFHSKRYTSWPSMTEDIDAGNLHAAFILAPLAMQMARQGKTKVKIVHLGHRDGTAIVVPTDSKVESFADLRGTRMAIPHRYANQRILVERMMAEYGFSEDDLKLIDYPPPEMPAALKAGAFESYIVGEPFAAKAEMDGFGRVLYHTKDIWPNFISCVLIVTQDLIDRDPALVQELVSGITASGKWLDEGDERLLSGLVMESASNQDDVDSGKVIVPDEFGRTPRLQAAVIAAQRRYYNQNPELLKFVLTKPPDRVKYTELELARDEFAEIQHWAEKLGFFDSRPVTEDDPFDFLDYCDPRFEQGRLRDLPLQDLASAAAEGAQ